MSTKAGTVYFDYIRDVLAVERDHKKALEQRGIAIITSTGAFLTLLTAIVTFGGAAVDSSVSGFRWFMLLAGLSFIVAAAAGLVANLPLNYPVPDAQFLRGLTDNDEEWGKDQERGQQVVANSIAGNAADAYESNETKGKSVLVGVGAQIVGVVALSVAVLFGVLPG
jgi:hypothetical protein